MKVSKDSMKRTMQDRKIIIILEDELMEAKKLNLKLPVRKAILC